MHRSHRILDAMVLVTALASTLALAHAQPSNADTVDQRQEIKLEPAERAFVLNEMRGFLASVEGIVAAVANDRVAEAHDAAKKSGMGVMHSVPPTLRTKLPKEFMHMGHTTHQAFDALAMDAKSMGEKAAVLKQLTTILNTCNTCHAAYRLSGG